MRRLSLLACLVLPGLAFGADAASPLPEIGAQISVPNDHLGIWKVEQTSICLQLAPDCIYQVLSNGREIALLMGKAVERTPRGGITLEAITGRFFVRRNTGEELAECDSPAMGYAMFTLLDERRKQVRAFHLRGNILSEIKNTYSKYPPCDLGD